MASEPYDPNNIFAKILRKEIPSYMIFETEHAYAFLDAFPMAKGHSLLIPKAPGYRTVMDMDEDTAANLLKELPRLSRAVKEVRMLIYPARSGSNFVLCVRFQVYVEWFSSLNS
mgnify:FL=1